MLFNSQIFIFMFLPLALAGWYILNHFKLYRVALVFVIGMSLWFYGYFNPSYLLIILGSMAGNYLISFIMERISKPKGKKVMMIVGILFNVAILGYYKYYDFFIGNLNVVFKTDFTLKHIILPLGISFFTLQQLSYIIDRSWGTAPHYNIIEYVAFVTFFPQLIAGPIVLHSELIPQFRDESKKKFNLSSFSDGIVLFSLGLMKKVLMADSIALFVNDGFEKVWYLDTLSAWLVSLGYALELYFDFSGYCDMAVGIGKMFNLDLPVNFKSPFKSHSVPEYWQRWHYTLTRFWQTYIFTPLTIKGMRKKNKTVKKIYSFMTPIIVFLISGIWHGASWTFVVWGLCEGIATVWSKRKFLKLKKNKFALCSTFIFTVFTSAIFRSESWEVMCRILKAMFVPSLSKITIELTGALGEMPEFYAITKAIAMVNPNLLNIFCPIVFALLIALSFVIIRGRNAYEILEYRKAKGFKTGFTVLLALGTFWSILSLTSISTFLYFNF